MDLPRIGRTSVHDRMVSGGSRSSESRRLASSTWEWNRAGAPWLRYPPGAHARSRITLARFLFLFFLCDLGELVSSAHHADSSPTTRAWDHVAHARSCCTGRPPGLLVEPGQSRQLMFRYGSAVDGQRGAHPLGMRADLRHDQPTGGWCDLHVVERREPYPHDHADGAAAVHDRGGPIRARDVEQRRRPEDPGGAHA